MKCDKALKIMEWHEGTGSLDLEHLKNCPDCQLEKSELDDFYSIMKTLRTPAAISPAAERKLNKITGQNIALESTRRSLKFWATLAKMEMLLLACLAVGMTFLFGRLSNQPQWNMTQALQNTREIVENPGHIKSSELKSVQNTASKTSSTNTEDIQNKSSLNSSSDDEPQKTDTVALKTDNPESSPNGSQIHSEPSTSNLAAQETNSDISEASAGSAQTPQDNSLSVTPLSTASSEPSRVTVENSTGSQSGQSQSTAMQLKENIATEETAGTGSGASSEHAGQGSAAEHVSKSESDLESTQGKNDAETGNITSYTNELNSTKIYPETIDSVVDKIPGTSGGVFPVFRRPESPGPGISMRKGISIGLGNASEWTPASSSFLVSSLGRASFLMPQDTRYKLNDVFQREKDSSHSTIDGQKPDKSQTELNADKGSNANNNQNLDFSGELKKKFGENRDSWIIPDQGQGAGTDTNDNKKPGVRRPQFELGTNQTPDPTQVNRPGLNSDLRLRPSPPVNAPGGPPSGEPGNHQGPPPPGGFAPNPNHPPTPPGGPNPPPKKPPLPPPGGNKQGLPKPPFHK